jgi:serine/threonine protein kinase
LGAARVVGERYELIRPVGRGGMGEVWAARDLRLDRRVAVKLLRPNALPPGVDQEVLISRFEREARLTARLEHPGVPAVHDTGSDSGDLYLVMQLIDGADLADFQAENEPVPIGWVAAVGTQVAAVLTVAHAASLVHRDLKPRNVMITLDGHVKVLDFGVAVLRDGDGTRITRTAESPGTPAYMAPEQAMHGAAGPPSDIYSLGCVLYELITGQQVFTAKTPLALMHRHYTDFPTPVATLRPEAGPALNELVARMLAKQPQRRPAAPEVHNRLAAMITIPPGVRDVPMDPTRPFRDRLPAALPTSVPAPGSAVYPAPPPEPPTRPVLPPVPPPLPTMPPKRSVLDGAKRAGDGILLTFSVVWTLFGLILVFTDDVATGLVGFFSGLLLILIAAKVRKVRLGLPHMWSVDRTDRGPAGGAEVTARISLLVTGVILLIVAVADAVEAITRQPGASATYMVLSGFLFAAGFLVPGLVMLRRRRRVPAGTATLRAMPVPPSAGRWG